MLFQIDFLFQKTKREKEKKPFLWIKPLYFFFKKKMF